MGQAADSPPGFCASVLQFVVLLAAKLLEAAREDLSQGGGVAATLAVSDQHGAAAGRPDLAAAGPEVDMDSAFEVGSLRGGSGSGGEADILADDVMGDLMSGLDASAMVRQHGGLPSSQPDDCGGLPVEEGGNLALAPQGSTGEAAAEHSMRHQNGAAAIRAVTRLLQDKRSAMMLALSCRHLPGQWEKLAAQIRLLEAFAQQEEVLPATADAVASLAASLPPPRTDVAQTKVMRVLGTAGGGRSWPYNSGWSLGGSSEAWLPLDLILEDAVEGLRTYMRPNPVLGETLCMLAALEGVTWQDTFLALWLTMLRAMTRGRAEIPAPRIECRLSMVLVVAPMVVAYIIEGDSPAERPGARAAEDAAVAREAMREAVASSLDLLANFPGLLYPPSSAQGVADQVAALVTAQEVVDQKGTMQDLLIAECSKRGLLPLRRTLPNPPSSVSWLNFLQGAPLVDPLRASILATPAQSNAELDHLYEVAVGGADEERKAATSALLGASLLRAWHLQERAAQLSVQLLCTHAATHGATSCSQLASTTPTLLAVLSLLAKPDTLRLLSLHAHLPALAAALLPICEVFGSLPSAIPLRIGPHSSPASFTIFSLALLLLERLQDYVASSVPRNPRSEPASCMGDSSGRLVDQSARRTSLQDYLSSWNALQGNEEPLSLDQFPTVANLYSQQQASAAVPATISSVVDKLISMVFREVMRSRGNDLASTDERSTLTGWEVVHATPAVTEAVLAAVAHNHLTSSDAIKGLKDLVEFVPASIVPLANFLAAESMRGCWRVAAMNGSEWPTPASNLTAVEAEIQAALTDTGVDTPPHLSGVLSGSGTLQPLPLAMFVSLTITFKSEMAEAILAVAGPRLIRAAAACPFPRPISQALWSMKLPRWHRNIVTTAAALAVASSHVTMSQLLATCFVAALPNSPRTSAALLVPPSPTIITMPASPRHIAQAARVRLGMLAGAGVALCTGGGAGALLGHGGRSRNALPAPAWVAGPPMSAQAQVTEPGALFLRACAYVQDPAFLCDEVLRQVAMAVAAAAAPPEQAKAAASSSGDLQLRCRSSAMCVRIAVSGYAAGLGAALLYIAGRAPLTRHLLVAVLPAWLLVRAGATRRTSPLEAYALARLAVISGMTTWGPGGSELATAASDRAEALELHLAQVLDDAEGCGAVTGDAVHRAYLTALVATVMTVAPQWLGTVTAATLARLATCLHRWCAVPLALEALTLAGPHALEAAIELTSTMLSIEREKAFVARWCHS
eukprot:SM000009S23565  [mRNA]  locus=s9:764498:771082:- [translate_table: standard]